MKRTSTLLADNVLTPLLLTSCLQHHKNTLSSPLSAPHVHHWLAFFAAQTISPSRTDAVTAVMPHLSRDVLSSIGHVWRLNARGDIIQQLVDSATVHKQKVAMKASVNEAVHSELPSSSSSSTMASTLSGEEVESGATLQAERTPVKDCGSKKSEVHLSEAETLVVLWCVHAALASLAASCPGGGALSVKDVKELLAKWLADDVIPLLDFFLLPEAREETGVKKGLSSFSCLRVLHSSLYYLSFSFNRTVPRGNAVESFSTSSRAMESSSEACGTSSVEEGEIEGTRAMCAFFTSASAILLRCVKKTGGKALQGNNGHRDLPFHERMHDIIRVTRPAHDTSLSEEAHVTSGTSETAFFAVLDKYLDGLLRGEGEQPIAAEVISLRTPFAKTRCVDRRASASSTTSPEAVESLNAQLSAIAEHSGAKL